MSGSDREFEDDRRREEARENFRRDAANAWAEYQATGQHLTAAEVDAWLARLEAGEDPEAPPP